jgi:hypothetical protein
MHRVIPRQPDRKLILKSSLEVEKAKVGMYRSYHRHQPGKRDRLTDDYEVSRSGVAAINRLDADQLSVPFIGQYI